MNNPDFQIVVSRVLRIGVLTSMAFVVAGVFLIFIRGGADGYTLAQLSNLGSSQVSAQLDSSMLPPSGIFSGIASLNGAYFIALGLWILVFTPISVVVISALEFFSIRNMRYVIMSLIVLVNLFVAMFLIR